MVGGKNMYKIKAPAVLALVIAVVFVFPACHVISADAELPWTFAPGITDKSEYPNSTLKIALSVSTPEELPRVLKYRMGTATGPYYFDYVVVSAAKMKKADTANWAFTLDLTDIQPILDRRSSLLSPLQSKGIKVLLEITNSGEGYTFANLPYNLREPFAKTVKDTLDRFDFDGVEFNDTNGGDNAYPFVGAAAYYDPYTDDTNDPANYGNTATVNNAIECDEYWHEGGLNYSSFLSYFRFQSYYPEYTQSIIGQKDNNPIIVRETGFASGAPTGTFYYWVNELGQAQRCYMFENIYDRYRPGFYFIAVTDQVNYFLSPNVNPSAETFGWEGTGIPVAYYINHSTYGPGIIDLAAATGDQLDYFTHRFVWGNNDNGDDSWNGALYELFYYKNIGDNDAEKLSGTSKFLYGTRDLGEAYNLKAVHDDGPPVVFVP